MRKVLCYGLLLTLLLWPASEALGQGKKGKNKQKPADPATPQDYQALAKMPGVLGQILTYDPVAKTMTVRVEYQVPDPNGKLAKTYFPNTKLPNIRVSANPYVRLVNEYQQILRIKKPAQQQKRLKAFLVKLQNQQQKDMFNYMLQVNQMQWPLQQQLARNLGYTGPYSPQTIPSITLAKEFELSLAPDLIVARKELELQYDDKGNIKQFTPEELKKLRDPKLPGYTAKLDDVMAGQQVVLYFKKADTKKDDKTKKDDPAKAADKGKDDKGKDDKGAADKGKDTKVGEDKGRIDPAGSDTRKDEKATPGQVQITLPTATKTTPVGDPKVKDEKAKEGDPTKDQKGKDEKAKDGDPTKTAPSGLVTDDIQRPGPTVGGILILSDVDPNATLPKKRN